MDLITDIFILEIKQLFQNCFEGKLSFQLKQDGDFFNVAWMDVFDAYYSGGIDILPIQNW